MNRTHFNGTLRLSNLGQHVELKGWVAKKRNLGGIIFIDLRDKTGITQIIVGPENKNYDIAESLKNEYVVYVSGIVIERQSKNPNLPTGEIEINADQVSIINTAEQPPIIVADKTDALEDTRLKYRYLDLRRPMQQQYIMGKSKIISAVREYLTSQDFLELETPILAKSTPEGARDYLVPSRLYRGEFYALPQSPQIFKQLYMIAGFEKYFQIAKCFRDEDLRADRQPEFNQIDIEISFTTQEEIWSLVEGMMAHTFKKILNIELPLPFPRMKYDDVMEKYGSDKPDIRFEMFLEDITTQIQHIPFLATNECTKAIVIPNANFSRKEIDEFTRIMKNYRVSGISFLRYQNGALSGSIGKFFEETELREAMISRLSLKEEDMVFVISSKRNIVNQALGALRNLIAKQLHLVNPNDYKFLWVTDWPVFELNEETGKYAVSTHPFTAPKAECVHLLDTAPEKVYANAYDLVLNGYELGSGSLRTYNQELQQKMFDVIGLTSEQIKDRFGFFVEALKYGTPPHGGIGLGVERIVMLMLQTDNIRDVVAFPKTLSARDLMMESPSRVDQEQLDDVYLMVKDE